MENKTDKNHCLHSYLIITMYGGRIYFYSQFTDEETEVQRSKSAQKVGKTGFELRPLAPQPQAMIVEALPAQQTPPALILGPTISFSTHQLSGIHGSEHCTVERLQSSQHGPVDT